MQTRGREDMQAVTQVMTAIRATIATRAMTATQTEDSERSDGSAHPQ